MRTRAARPGSAVAPQLLLGNATGPRLHLEVHTAGNELAGVHQLVGRRCEAITMLQRTLSDGEASLGTDFPLAGQIRANLQVTLAAEQR